jgi:glucose/mannose transport system substrate-binding protein
MIKFYHRSQLHAPVYPCGLWRPVNRLLAFGIRKEAIKLVEIFLVAIVLMIIFAGRASADPPLKAEVMHWWTSPGEAAAVHECVQAFNNAGGQWVDVPIVGGTNAIPAEISRVSGGDPPTAMQLPLGKQLDDLVPQNRLANLDDLAAADNFKAILPDVFLKAATYNGHVYALPINNHGHNWLWYNNAVLKKAGAKEPVT